MADEYIDNVTWSYTWDSGLTRYEYDVREMFVLSPPPCVKTIYFCVESSGNSGDYDVCIVDRKVTGNGKSFLLRSTLSPKSGVRLASTFFLDVLFS